MNKEIRGKFIYSRGFKCWVSGEMYRLYGEDFHVTIYDEGPHEGSRNLITDKQMKIALQEPKT